MIRAATHRWLDLNVVRTTSDVALGAVALIAGLAAVLGARSAASGAGASASDIWIFPAVIGKLLLGIGAVLLVRGWLGRTPRVHWRLRDLAIIAILVTVVDVVVAWQWGGDLALRFGPPEMAVLAALKLTVAIALARLSRLRAIGMVLLGLLLTTIGVDVATGVLRFTMGLETLLEGVDAIVVALGVVVIADGVICLLSPSRCASPRRWPSPRRASSPSP